MEAKQALAELIVARYHGRRPAVRREAEFQQKFQEREFPDEPDMRLVVTADMLRDGGGIGLVDLVARTGLVPSKSEARRLIIQGGVEIDGVKQSDANFLLIVVAGRPYRLKIGRRKFAIVERAS